MINADSNEKQVKRMLAFLEKLDFSEHNSALAERYLNGEIGDEALTQFERMELIGAPIGLCEEPYFFMRGLNKQSQKDIAIRWFRIVYAVGGNTCSEIFQGDYTNLVYHTKEIDLYQRMVLYMKHCIKYSYATKLLIAEQWKRLAEIADYDAKNVRAAIKPIQEEGDRYALVALTLYFNIRYQKSDKIAEEDTVLMELYENTLLDWLDKWVVRQEYIKHIKKRIKTDKRAELRAAISSGQLTEELVRYMKTQGMTKEETQHFQAVSSMAYLNFPLSDTLKNIVKSCMAIYAMAALFSLENTYISEKEDIRYQGADYDELFDINPETYICWAAMTNNTNILKRQLEKHQKIYLKALDEKTFDTPILLYRRIGGSGFLGDALDAVNVLKDVIKQENPKLYRQIKIPSHEQMITRLVKELPHAALAKEYLRGNCAISKLYPYEKECVDVLGWQYNLFQLQWELSKYLKHCKDEEFANRCKAFLVIGRFEFLRVEGKGADGIKQFFAVLEKEQLDIAHQLSGFRTLYKAERYNNSYSIPVLLEGAEEVFTKYLCAKREETLTAFSQAGAEGRYLALRVLRNDLTQNRQEILNYAADSAKLVREELLNILYAQTDWEEDIKALLKAKKTAQREIAVQVLAHWHQEDNRFQEVLLQAVEKEKNAKVMALLQDALHIGESVSDDNKTIVTKTISTKEIVEQVHRGNRKRSLMWAYATPFSVVHKKDGEKASEEYLQAVFLCYASQDKCGINKNAALLALDLNIAEFAQYVNELFDRWLEQGAESKKRWVLYAASIHGGEEIIEKLQRQIQEWPLVARGAIAAEAVKALALNPSPRALLIVDGMARKFKFKQVKAAAAEALEFAAVELGITREELSDRIVPDLGFDEKMQRIFDYGERMFKVTITPTLEIGVYDEKGKKLKNLPAPGKRDNETKAAAAYNDFKQMKKQMKVAVNSQKARLEYALSTKREWSVEAWTNLFVKNPLMHQFAIGFIWGIYENDQLIQSFRYMEDGSFNTKDEEEYRLPDKARISLVHPIELSDEEKTAWREQLADYEIIQPIAQLDREIYYVTKEEAGEKALDRFSGCRINDLSLNGRLTEMGWYRGSVQDGGGFYTYYREDAEAGIGVELHFSGTYVGGWNEEVTILDVRFYKAGTIARGSYVYDEADDTKAYCLRDVPARYFSEIVLQLAKVTASGEKSDID